MYMNVECYGDNDDQVNGHKSSTLENYSFYAIIKIYQSRVIHIKPILIAQTEY